MAAALRLLLPAALLAMPLAGAQDAAMIHVAQRDFIPRGTTVNASANVTVMGFDPEAHSLTADDGSFDVEVPAPAPGGYTTVWFDAPATGGNRTFHCRYHPEMTGWLVVVGPAAARAPLGPALALIAGGAAAALLRRR